MSSPAPTSESHAVRGAIDRGALLDFRSTFESVEPLAAGELDDFFDPSELRVRLDDGVGDAESARIDVAWTTLGDYNVHYTDDSGRNLRWDVHPHDYPAPPTERHFHPPPHASSDPDDVCDSCITVTEIDLVARATQKLYRTALERGSFGAINDARNPP